MPVDRLPPSVRRENAQNALAEIRACYGELQTFVAGEFDRLEALAAELLTEQTTAGQSRQKTDQKVMQEQIDQLARVATEFAKSVAEQKRLASVQH